MFSPKKYGDPYSKLSLADAQQEYDQVMGRFPIQ
jgi:hypothetical protein